MVSSARTVRGDVALVLVTIDVAVMTLDVFIQTILSQTREVAVYTADHGVTCQR